MARQRPLPKRPTRSRVQTCISGDVHERVDLYCAHYGITEARFFELAALEKLDGMGDSKTIARQLALMNEQIEIMSEHNNLFVQLWLQNTQLFTKKEQDEARRQTTAVYQGFTQQITTNLSGGAGFLSACHQRLRKSHHVPAEARPSTPSGTKTAA